MAKFTAKTYSNETLNVDGHEYVNCTFRQCRLRYSGGPVPMFKDYTMEGCTFELVDAADRTVGFLVSLARSGNAALVKDLFKGAL